MKLCIFGAGAIGSYFGGQLALAGHDVSFIARGEHLKAMQKNGLTISNTQGDSQHVNVNAVATAAELPKQDVIFVTVKSNMITDAAADIATLMHEDTTVIYCVNGMPWWYFYQHGGRWDGHTFDSIDPNATIWNTLDPKHALGCVVYSAASLVEAGHVKYVVGEAGVPPVFLGEPAGGLSERLNNIAAIVDGAGIPTKATEDIRHEVWHKLWGNIAMNPISALTHATMDEVVEQYDDIDLVESVMNETRFIAEKLDVTFRERPEQRIAHAAKLKGHKTSMLQDIERGRPTEIEAIVGAVREIGRITGADTPYLNTLYSLVKQKERFSAPYRQSA